MIIKAYKQEDEIIHGDVESVECTIKTDDAKLFHILSNLYSRPLDAVIRELSTNCLDGHRVVGKEKVPFELRINDSVLDDELNITFRDFGPGMSKATIVKVFSTFGESTKINSNLETGCLGLGSKSPFAVTSTFMVTSYIDNVKYVYNMSKDATGRPKITLFAEAYTEEPNGMEINVPLDRKNYNKAQIINAIRMELYFFRTKPNIFVNGVIFEQKFPRKNYKKTYRGCYLVDNINTPSDYDSIVKSMAIQGEIGYNFDIKKLLQNCPTDNTLDILVIGENNSINSKTKDILSDVYGNFDIHMYFDNGTISFAPSREELLYDPLTVQNLLIKCMGNTKAILAKFHNFMTNISLPELAIWSQSKIDFKMAYDQKTFMSFYGKVINWANGVKKILEIYIANQPFFGKVWTKEELEYMSLTKCSYFRQSDTNPDVRVRLNSYGQFNSGWQTDLLDSTPVVALEQLQVLKCKVNYNNTFIEVASIKGNKLKSHTSIDIVGRDYKNMALLCVDLHTQELKSYKPKIEAFLKDKGPDGAEQMGIKSIFLIRYSYEPRMHHVIDAFIGKYGIDYKLDLKIIGPELINEHNAKKKAEEKAERIELKEALLAQAAENGSTDIVEKMTRLKDEVPYYKLCNIKSFGFLNESLNGGNIFSRNSKYDSYETFTYKGTIEDDITLKNMLYIPLDNKNKTMSYLQEQVKKTISYDLFSVEKINDDKDDENFGKSYKSRIRDWYTGLDDILYLRYARTNFLKYFSNASLFNIEHPFSNKTLIVMNEEKAKKLGIRSFDEYFKRTIKKVFDFTKIKKPMLIVDMNSYYKDRNNVAYMQIFSEMFGLIPNKYSEMLIDNLRNKKSSSYKDYLEREEIIREQLSTRFTNIVDKLLECEPKHKLIESIKDNIITDDIMNNNQVYFTNYHEYSSQASKLVETVKAICPDAIIDFKKTKWEKKYSPLKTDIVAIGQYLISSIHDSYTIDKDNTSKLISFRGKIDNYLLTLNDSLLELSTETVHTFIDPVAVKKDSEKEADATDDVA